MLKCVLYPEFSITLNWGLEARYRKNGRCYEKRNIVTSPDYPPDPGWQECSMANYALALLKAHEDQAK